MSGMGHIIRASLETIMPSTKDREPVIQRIEVGKTEDVEVASATVSIADAEGVGEGFVARLKRAEPYDFMSACLDLLRQIGPLPKKTK